MPLTGAPPPAGANGQGVAILLPLSGPRADIGQTMVRAAQLALDMPGAPSLDVKDTGGTPSGAAAAAQAAIAAGAGLILGPLTSPETASVAPVARAANVAMLAFTNDPSQAQPGVWTLGITPAQQVRRLVAASQGQGKSEFAGLLPDNDFGHAMGQALTQATAASSLAPANVRFYAPGMPAINAAATCWLRPPGRSPSLAPAPPSAAPHARQRTPRAPDEPGRRPIMRTNHPPR